MGGSSTPVVEYVRGSDYGGGVGGILYTIRGSTPSYTHYNNRGDVVAKTAANGSLTYEAAYEAYGKRTAEQGATDDRQKANTKDEDPTGLLNEGFRYRDLETGTFITRDPLGFVDGPNMYAYVVQNPWTKFDPLGLKVNIKNKSEKKQYDRYKEKVSGGKNNLEKEIINSMESSAREFNFNKASDVEKHVKVRAKTVEYTKHLMDKLDKFPNATDKSSFNENVWTKDLKKGGWIPKDGDWGKALNDVFENTGKYTLDCSQAATLPMLKAIYEVDGKLAKEFYKSWIPTSTKDSDDWIPGEIGGFRPDVTPGARMGKETVAYLGKNENGERRYRGHPYPEGSDKEYEARIIGWGASKVDTDIGRLVPSSGLMLP